MESEKIHSIEGLDWKTLLPQRFEFYHLGQVEAQSTGLPFEPFEENQLDESSILGFQLYGSARVLLILLFDKALDLSTYSELGNVLTSQVATQLNSKIGTDTMISPPELITSQQLQNLLRRSKPSIRRTYRHSFGDLVILLEALIFPVSPEGIGYA
jgi:hypothetical protein